MKTRYVSWMQPEPSTRAPRRVRAFKRGGLNSASMGVLRLLIHLAKPSMTDGLTIPEIREFCRCSRRQAYRHLDALKDVGVPILTDSASGPGILKRHRLGNLNIEVWAPMAQSATGKEKL